MFLLVFQNYTSLVQERDALREQTVKVCHYCLSGCYLMLLFNLASSRVRCI